jgi:phage terminase small subunit
MSKPKTAPKSKSKPKAQETGPSTTPNPAKPKTTSRKVNSKGLTPKQEKFAQEYVITGNASEAYRRSYSASNMGANPVEVEACRLLQSPKVALRVKEIQSKIAERHEITVDDLVVELEEARKLAKVTEQPSSMVAATMGKGKLLGMIVDRKDITVHSQISAMTDEELAAFIDEVDVDDDDYDADTPS